MIAPACTSLEAGGGSSPLIPAMQSRRDCRADSSLPMMAKGAQRVMAQERPTQATRNVALACEVMKKVRNMARAKKVWPQNQSWEMRSCFEDVEELALLRVGSRKGRRILKRKATMAKRKEAKVPKRMASSQRPVPSLASVEVDEALGTRATMV